MLRKITILLSALAMMGVMVAPPAMANHQDGHVNRGNQLDDGEDKNKGGGQEHIRNGHPPKGGGECHAGGCGNRGGND
jgi:hypothetical protein